ncbi:MAG: sulfurtransferase TusA family protein [Planctomycetes bacterium]|nr:sulfurtransferase TusA family protein [Planctomycetota bacterium]
MTEESKDAPAHDVSIDAGDLGCGDLVLRLRNELKPLAPGAVVHVRATDPAAPIDLPAWCGLVGHTLIHTKHPHYWIQKKTT